MSKVRKLALPQDNERLKYMSDLLYTKLVAMSKHNPKKDEIGEYKEYYNYIYMDANPKTGEKGFSHQEMWESLGMSRATYYRKFKKLQELKLIKIVHYYNRRVLLIPFINASELLDLRTCEFLTRVYRKLGLIPDDIIKVLCLAKIQFKKDKLLTVNQLKKDLGYSTSNKNKNEYVRFLLDILRSLDLIDFKINVVQRGDKIAHYFYLKKVDDTYNERLKSYDKMDNAQEINTEKDFQIIDIKN